MQVRDHPNCWERLLSLHLTSSMCPLLFCYQFSKKTGDSEMKWVLQMINLFLPVSLFSSQTSVSITANNQISACWCIQPTDLVQSIGQQLWEVFIVVRYDKPRRCICFLLILSLCYGKDPLLVTVLPKLSWSYVVSNKGRRRLWQGSFSFKTIWRPVARALRSKLTF